jgi:hypothetical protein
MNISEVLNILNDQLLLKRTPKGRAISEFGIKAIEATIQDTKNYENPAIRCLGCGFVVSSLLVADGCPNCGVIDLTENIIEE